MRKVLLWLIDTPARLVGELIATIWPVLGLAAAGGLGYFAYRMLLPRIGHRGAVAVAIVAGLYAAMVMYQSEKWTAFALLHHYDD